MNSAVRQYVVPAVAAVLFEIDVVLCQNSRYHMSSSCGTVGKKCSKEIEILSSEKHPRTFLTLPQTGKSNKHQE